MLEYLLTCCTPQRLNEAFAYLLGNEISHSVTVLKHNSVLKILPNCTGEFQATCGSNTENMRSPLLTSFISLYWSEQNILENKKKCFFFQLKKDHPLEYIILFIPINNLTPHYVRIGILCSWSWVAQWCSG